LTSDDFLADVAAVFTGGQTKRGALGSGRLIAPGLVLTSGHVVDYPTRETAVRTGWEVHLLRERTKDGAWENSPHEAEVIWRGPGDLDVALLRVIGEMKLMPATKQVFASYDRSEPAPGFEAAGFPQAWFIKKKVRDYTVSGSLRVASQHGPYAWSVSSADKPDDAHGWKGMSGAAVCRVGTDDKIYVFGVVEDVPENFTGGLLQVARLSYAFTDSIFRDHVLKASGEQPDVIAYASVISGVRTYIISPDEIFRRVNIEHFQGRLELRAKVDSFLKESNQQGYIILEADAGLGKTTFLAHLVKERGYINHFISRASSPEDMLAGIESIAAQLICLWDLGVYVDEAGLKDAEEGRLIPHEEVFKEFS